MEEEEERRRREEERKQQEMEAQRYLAFTHLFLNFLIILRVMLKEKIGSLDSL